MFTYTLAFLKRGDEILMLNRNKSPWMGAWNGVGGKKENGESVKETITREIFEETNIKVSVNSVIDKGYVTWNSFDENGNGLHLFLVELPNDFIYETPVVTNEGILDWKKISWVSDYDNYGVCDNIPYFINDVIFSNKRFNHICNFDDRVLVSVKKVELED